MADSAKARLRQFFVDNLGQVVTAKQLQQVAAPVSEWARRVRELREEEAWPISTYHDDASLKPGEYRLTALPPDTKDIKFKRGISQRLRAEVLDRNGFTCQMCGKTPGDIDPDTGRKVRLHIGHIVDKSLGGKDEPSNLRTLCSTCNQGAKNITTEKPSGLWLLTQIRRANIDDQLAVRDWLNKKFS
jgi:5-methylcytosine-specific restriction endonuclease McrA